MSKYLRHAAFVLAVLLAPISAVSQTFTTGNFIGVWSLFEDGDYCWIATRFSGKPKRAMTFILDNDGDPAILLGPGASEKFTVWKSIVLKTGTGSFDFAPDGVWARPVSKADNKRIISALMGEDTLFLTAIASNSKGTREIDGRFKTKRAAKGITAMKKRCGWRAD